MKIRRSDARTPVSGYVFLVILRSPLIDVTAYIFDYTVRDGKLCITREAARTPRYDLTAYLPSHRSRW